MKTFKWKCPQCETTNVDVTCRKCSHMPEYYIPLKTVSLKPEKIKPVPGEMDEQDWICSHCGEENESKQKRCIACEEPRVKKKKRKTGVRGWLVVTVFLICVLVIILVVVGKLTAITRPEVLSGDFSAIFNPTQRSETITSPADSPPQLEVNRVYPNPPVDGCVMWSDITVEDTGKVMCVYGLVYDAYMGEPGQFNIRFSDEKDTFRMVMTDVDELEAPDVWGACVYQTAVIKSYQSLAYMSFLADVKICEQ
ncbi:MAG: hypothetical protein JEZ00_22285 [Anaerolineaceae bacterium]|nr:hypothetical protein [Anaerolineaceae bacterium]